ncbi:MAG TPA: galactokinase family protein [Gemmatimonadaceae bacterium]|nr:galactokinase family protein [Gemmatimonadaceae bacterium]
MTSDSLSGPGTDRADEAARHRALIAAFRDAFGGEPDLLSSAPGRNTAIGDHLDYPPLPQDGTASSQTIAWATRENVLVAGRRRADRGIGLLSLNDGKSFVVDLDDLEALARAAAHDLLPDVDGQPPHSWAMSTLALLYSAARGVPDLRPALPVFGADLAFAGNVPQGAGQGSSAAFLVAVTLACNEAFDWRIPPGDAFALADIARSGEHQGYSPFIRRGRAGYLDQMVSLTAREGKAVVIDHGNHAGREWVDLAVIESRGYRNVVVLSGLSRALAETDYITRVDELSRLPSVLNRILAARRAVWADKAHVHQFTPGEWREAAPDLEREDPTLARRARYVFEERERCARFRAALTDGRIDELLDVVNASGEAMSMNGPYQISGYNRVPARAEPVAALDLLREIVLRHAGPRSAARLIGGGGAGPLLALVPQAVCDAPGFTRAIAQEWLEATGLTARVTMDAPGRGAGVVWRRAATR